MSRYLLPDLGEGASTNIEGSGRWFSSGSNELAKLTADLEKSSTGDGNVTAIPDLWAHPKLVEIILSNQKHPLYKKYIGQWRGIIAMLALREFRSIKQLGLETIDIPDPTSNKASEGPKFFQVITKMLDKSFKNYPDDTVAAGYKYKIQIITFNEHPLAIVWPNLLLCPSVTLQHGMTSAPVKWWSDNEILDPCEFLGKDEKMRLTRWLEKAAVEVSDYELRTIEVDGKPVERKNYYAEKLVNLLQSFAKDLGKTLDAEELSQFPKEIKYGSNATLPITGYSSLLGSPIGYVEDSNFIKNSNVLLQSRDKKRQILAVSNNIGTLWGIANSDVIVAGAISLETIFKSIMLGKVEDKNKLGNVGLEKYNTQVWAADNFFTRKIMLVSSSESNVFPNIQHKHTIYRKGEDVNIVLPIHEEVLQFLTPKEISDNITIVMDDEDIVVDLKLKVNGKVIDGKLKNEIHITKKYCAKNGEIFDKVKETAPLIQIWPNFVTEQPSKWQAYYSFYDRLKKPTSRSFYARPSATCWNYDKQKGEVVERNISVSNSKVQILRGKTFPESYTCYEMEEDVILTEDHEMGIICIQKPKEAVVERIDNCRIGIDFGTTNSVAYISTDSLESEDGDGTHVLTLKDRVFNVTYLPSDVRADLRRYFIPASDQPDTKELKNNTSIRTIFNDYVGSYSGDEDKPLIRGNIYYLEGARSIGDDVEIKDSIHDDMKWTQEKSRSSGETVNRIKGFLLQLSLQCMAEAVAMGVRKIQWNYSYPKAYDGQQQDTLSGIWHNTIIPVLNEISSDKKHDIEIGTNDEHVSKKTESKAMSDYFTKKMQAAVGSRGIVCFDIGGGSTDIAIWLGDQSREPIHQCSFKFAGQDILSRYLFNKQKKKGDLLMALATKEPIFVEQLKRVCSKKTFKEFNLELEALLKYHEESIFKGLSANSQDADLYIVLRDVTYALSGIFFYTGMILCHLLKEGKFGTPRKLPHCYIGGNASKLLNWATRGVSFEHSSLGKVFLNCLWYGIVAEDKEYAAKLVKAGFKNEAKFYPSSQPKEEVAYGLVAKKAIEDNGEDDGIVEIDMDDMDMDLDMGMGTDPDNIDIDNNDYVVAGEPYFEGDDDDELSTSDIMMKKQFGKGAKGIRLDADHINLTRFTNVFNKLVCDKFELYKDSYVNLKANFDDICDRVDENLVRNFENGQKSINAVELEPIFIMELKQALEALSKK